MIKPIYLLGEDVLRKQTEDIEQDSTELQTLIDDMLETMADAKGIGLAAPQIGHLERLFVVDVSAMEEDFKEAGIDMPEQPMVFINAEIEEESEAEDDFEEGCLSIPDINETVIRPEGITMSYLDRAFQPQRAYFDGILARVIQHEYDHVEGILFIDHISAFRRRLLKRRITEIRNGITEATYTTYTKKTGVILPEEDIEE